MANILGLGLDAAAGGVSGIVGTALGRVAGFLNANRRSSMNVNVGSMSKSFMSFR